MARIKRVIPYINRAKMLGNKFETLDDLVTDRELAMSILCWLSKNYKHLIAAMFAATNDERLTFDFV